MNLQKFNFGVTLILATLAGIHAAFDAGKMPSAGGEMTPVMVAILLPGINPLDEVIPKIGGFFLVCFGVIFCFLGFRYTLEILMLIVASMGYRLVASIIQGAFVDHAPEVKLIINAVAVAIGYIAAKKAKDAPEAEHKVKLIWAWIGVMMGMNLGQLINLKDDGIRAGICAGIGFVLASIIHKKELSDDKFVKIIGTAIIGGRYICVGIACFKPDITEKGKFFKNTAYVIIFFVCAALGCGCQWYFYEKENPCPKAFQNAAPSENEGGKKEDDKKTKLVV